MDYRTKPLSRSAIRQLSKYIRKIFKLNESEPFPVLDILERVCIMLDGVDYIVVEDDDLPSDIFTWFLEFSAAFFISTISLFVKE